MESSRSSCSSNESGMDIAFSDPNPNSMLHDLDTTCLCCTQVLLLVGQVIESIENNKDLLFIQSCRAKSQI